MRKIVKLLSVFFLTFVIQTVSAQKVTFDPVDWSSDQPVTIKFDFNGTAFAGTTSDLYLWGWVVCGSSESIDSPNNGTWAASALASKLTNTGGNIFKITITPTTHFGLGKQILDVAGINFLVKNLAGTQQTGNFTALKPLSVDGITPNTAWAANKKVRLLVDVSGTSLSGNAGPLYYWAWYNSGGGDQPSPNNGTGFGASSAASAMTRIGTTDLWYIDIVPTNYFNTSAANLSATTVFGLVKTQNGSAQTPDLGFGKAFKKYVIYQLNASNVTLTPAMPADNVPVTVTFTSETNLLNTATDVFMHTGVVTDKLASTTWSNTQGTWGTSTSVGKMTKTSANTYTLALPSIRSYYALAAGETAYKIMAVFRNPDGTIIEKDGAKDFQLPILLTPYLEVREPLGTFITKPINQPFRITGYVSTPCNYTISVNGTTVFTATGVNRASTTYTPTTAGVYNVVITAVNGGATYTKTLNIAVCGTTSLAMAAPLPAGLKYGINYNATDATKATLVLHAPTESITSVHVIGDFNAWAVDCNYLMNYDAAKKTFWRELTGLTAGQEYVFQYLIDGSTRIGDPYAQKVSDPWHDATIPAATYPGLIQYPNAAKPQNGETPTIAAVLQTNQPVYVWQIPSFNRPSPNKLNIYQLHFRDFTTEGTFKAAIGKLDYLKRMGITAIETLPVSEFEGNDSWGYNPNYYFAVDKAYGTKNEYKLFVDECHKRGIAVLGDVVLNHAFGTNAHARMYWDETNSRPATNNPWFNAVSNFTNPDAQWGNDFNHNSPHTRALVDSVNRFWLEEFKIDGIRFDFTKGFSNTVYPNASCSDVWGSCYDAGRVFNLKRMADKFWAINNGATGALPIFICEHLAMAAENTELANYGMLQWGGNGVSQQYEKVAEGQTGAQSVGSAYYKNQSFNSANWISYMESHDEQRLGYFQTISGNGNVRTDLAARSQFLQVAAATNLLFPGGRMVWQFGELGYDVDINFNGRTGKKPIRWDYLDVPERKKIYETYSRLFFLRNTMSTFHQAFDEGCPSCAVGSKSDLNSQFKRYHFYTAVGDTAVTVIANTGNSIVSGDPKLNSTAATWYEYMSQTNLPASTSITLQPGEFRVYINKPLTQSGPAYALSATAGGPFISSQTGNILLTFDRQILKTVSGSFLGDTIMTADVASLVEIRDAANNLIPIGGGLTFDKKTLTIDPISNLPAGSYTLTLLANKIQNYGGIAAGTSSFAFTVSSCSPQAILSSPTDDYTSGTNLVQVSNNIQASNKTNGTANTTYDAKNYVLLKPGFKADSATNSTFKAIIGGCN